MNDIIYRSSAITLPVMPKEYRKYQTQNIDDAYDQGWYDLQKCIEQLPSAQPQPEPQWIPCSERLPEEKDAGILKKLGTNKRSDYVIATVEAKGERMTVTACTYDGAWHGDMKYAFPDYKIIAWMPLPEPYQTER